MSHSRFWAACCLALTVCMSLNSDQAEARWWSSSSMYSSSYFHDYHNYGASYSYRPYSYYNGYYGARSYGGYNPTSYYGGWNVYAPYAYTPNEVRYVQPETQYVSYGAPSSCSSCGTAVTTYSAPVTACAPTCCDAPVATCSRPRCGLLGGLCPFRRACHKHAHCGSFAYSSSDCCGW